MGEGPTREIGPDPLAEGSMDEDEAPESELEEETEILEDDPPRDS